jgi:hypothetical protein
MTKLNYEHQALTIPSTSQSDPEPARRLIVLVPSLEVDLNAVTRRVWELASATGARIKFLSLCSDRLEEPSLRRRLATLSALVKDDKVFAEAEVIFGRNWVEAVKSRWQAGDMVVCCAEQRAGLWQKPLSQILHSDLNVPLYILSGLYPQNDSSSSWPMQAAAWLGFIAIIMGFFTLQVKIDQLAKDLTIVLQLLTTAVEFWLIWVWNNLFK